MASTPPSCSISTTKQYQNHRCPQNLKNHRHTQHQNHVFWTPLIKPSPSSHNAATSTRTNTTSSPLSQDHGYPSLCSAPSQKSQLAADFSGRQSTRFVSKMHFGRPKTCASARHTSIAEEVLQQAIHLGKDDESIHSILLSFEPKLCGSDDYIFLLRELGNRGECWKAIRCFEFAVRREKRKNDQGKLASAMISTLGRLGKVEPARRVFETAKAEGYGNTVYAFSALISAYGRSGYCDEAIRVFESMKQGGLKPNLVTYNAVIDACGKGGVEFKRVVQIFDEMLQSGVQPDRITYNSLLAACSRGGLWEAAQGLFSEMVDRGIDQDIFTYNTLLDALCKGGQMDVAIDVMKAMPAKKIMPNVVTYSTVVDGYAKVGRLEEALNLFDEMRYLAIGLDRVSYNTLLSIYTKLGRF